MKNSLRVLLQTVLLCCLVSPCFGQVPASGLKLLKGAAKIAANSADEVGDVTESIARQAGKSTAHSSPGLAAELALKTGDKFQIIQRNPRWLKLVTTAAAPEPTARLLLKHGAEAEKFLAFSTRHTEYALNLSAEKLVYLNDILQRAGAGSADLLPLLDVLAKSSDPRFLQWTYRNRFKLAVGGSLTLFLQSPADYVNGIRNLSDTREPAAMAATATAGPAAASPLPQLLASADTAGKLTVIVPCSIALSLWIAVATARRLLRQRRFRPAVSHR